MARRGPSTRRSDTGPQRKVHRNLAGNVRCPRGQWGMPRSSLKALLLLFLCVVPPALAADAASPADELRALHEKVMRAHRENDVELLLEDEAADYVVGNRGVITRPILAQRRERLGPYLRSTAFSAYRDMTEPVVTTSADGTLGWVRVQVEARGVQTSDSGEKQALAFVSAWIELYEKREGRWYRVGNLSNFKP
jgi:hypothetical protein